MKIKLNTRNRGFTIIEVMIVLAIAGLILAIVLLAVPALQRSQRNNARQNDATHVSGLINDYTSNHGGAMPASSAGVGTAFNTTGEKFSQFTSVTVSNDGTTFGTTTTAVVQANHTCDSSTNPPTLTAKTGSFAVTWQYESPGGNTKTCISD
jgi:prepilin-type N-terminal cleavage/methylation domain-containing protein